MAAVVESGNRMPRGLELFVLGVDFEIHVGIETGELIVTLRIGNLRADVVGLLVSQVNDAVDDGVLTLVEDVALDGAQLRAVTLALGAHGNAGENQNSKNKGYRGSNPRRSRSQVHWASWVPVLLRNRYTTNV